MNSIFEELSKYEALYSKECLEMKPFNDRIRRQSERWIDKPAADLPKIKINWDLSESSQRFSLDRFTKEAFSDKYPNGFAIGRLRLEELDRCLSSLSYRKKDNIWDGGSKSKLAFLIQYALEGYSISPILVKPNTEQSVILFGGHHRYALAKATDSDVVPICVEWQNVHAIGGLLDVKWVNV
ncbi:ParB-like nuclease family protein [Vibrio crassostreae]|uniref:hypothetical protein n=1 Tax=Vibrio crassostreae TaxID=246167 RepID=UPI001049BCE6|nr:hypothetical protein [Vibrio crassostreae]TCN82440.1 hypothetical protein EDB37_102274 [Vibrio crassostreae]CAK2463053.1 ParB-like nuclease family protein [Vibrio crassostreae]CAK2468798.1 ParB-like nuclease family protein [Vibrio crassostreae]CAK3018212.1 ParB-like nuclease family protein [Vibrio crassostreae]CAK3541535.1 ParB-like nuclease family protein [Vibrio crassostreae]